MKKLLSLILVLGMVSLAGAGLRSLQREGENAVSVVSDDSGAYNVLLAYSPSLVATLELTPMAAAGDKSYIKDYDLQNMGDYDLPELGVAHVWEINIASSQAGVLQPGAGCVATFDGVKLGDVDMGLGRIDLLDSNALDDGTLEILGSAFVIPEPASMLLLGLGGLFLRRK